MAAKRRLMVPYSQYRPRARPRSQAFGRRVPQLAMSFRQSRVPLPELSSYQHTAKEGSTLPNHAMLEGCVVGGSMYPGESRLSATYPALPRARAPSPHNRPFGPRTRSPGSSAAQRRSRPRATTRSSTCGARGRTTYPLAGRAAAALSRRAGRGSRQLGCARSKNWPACSSRSQRVASAQRRSVNPRGAPSAKASRELKAAGASGLCTTSSGCGRVVSTRSSAAAMSCPCCRRCRRRRRRRSSLGSSSARA